MEDCNAARLLEEVPHHVDDVRETIEELESLSADLQSIEFNEEAASSSLLNVPLQSSLKVYQYSILMKRVAEIGRRDVDIRWLDEVPREKKVIGLFLVSKQISEEALDILSGSNLFQLDLDSQAEITLREYVPERNRLRMRFLVIVLTY